MLLSVDVDYRFQNDKDYYAIVAGISFNNWCDNSPINTYHSLCKPEEYGDYEPGGFYKRELPCILKLLNEYKLSPSVIIIGGFVYLNKELDPGLGWYLYNKTKIPVVGIAENPFREIIPDTFVYRGNSEKPLYVSTVGLSLEETKEKIRNMHGKYRLPTLIKLTDRESRVYLRDSQGSDMFKHPSNKSS